jgi:hypothetical protein
MPEFIPTQHEQIQGFWFQTIAMCAVQKADQHFWARRGNTYLYAESKKLIESLAM